MHLALAVHAYIPQHGSLTVTLTFSTPSWRHPSLPPGTSVWRVGCQVTLSATSSRTPPTTELQNRAGAGLELRVKVLV